MKQEGDLSPFTEDYVTIKLVEIWHPTPFLRWSRDYLSIEMVNYNLVLQQKWQCNTGEQEWRDVQEED